MTGVDTTDQHPAHEPEPSATLATRDESAQEPSAAWGWHGTFPRTTAIAGWISAAALFLMLIGNHESHVEDAWLIGLGTLLVIMLIGGSISRFRARRR